VVEGRKIEVNNATARVMTKKPTTTNPATAGIPNGELAAIALRGAAFTRGRPRFTTAAAAAAAAAAAFRHPTPLATAATGLPYTALVSGTPQAAALNGVYQDPFLAAADIRYQPYAAGYAAAATRYAIPTVATAATYAATGGAVLNSAYGREFTTDPYIGHSIGPVAGYGAALYRGGYQRFTPY